MIYRKIKTLCLSFVLALTVGVMPVAAAGTANTSVTTGSTANATNCPGGEGDSATTSFQFNGKGGSNGKVCISDLVTEVMHFLTGLAGIAVVVGIMMGGIKISTAQGNAGQLEQGIGMIVNSVVGLILYILMFAIINFMVPGGILR